MKEREKERKERTKNNFLFCNIANNNNNLNESILSAVSQVSIQLSDLDIDDLEENEDDLLNDEDENSDDSNMI